MTTKICNKCEKELQLEEFYNSNRRRDGKYNVCKTCTCAYNKLLDAKPGYREKRLEQNRQRYINHKAEQAAYYRAYYIKNKEKIKAKNLAYYYAHKEELDRKALVYYHRNKKLKN